MSVAIVDRDARMVATTGDASRLTLARSAAKPFQAIPLVKDGVVDRFDVSDAELALACASHSSERRQVRAVAGWLDRMGFEETDLACGAHAPLATSFAVPPIGDDDDPDIQPASPSPLASNCSGKHAGMLGLARVCGWDPSDYHAIGHPVQERMKSVFADYTGVEPAGIIETVDGCGVSAFGAPLDRLAVAFARLITRDDPSAKTVVRAMTDVPEYVAGERRSCTEVMREYPGGVVAKVGAEGVYGAAVVDRGLGVAIKVEDGSAAAGMVALVAVLDALNLGASSRARLKAFARMPITNTRGEAVGMIEPRGAIAFV